ncbi:leucine-rich repeat domain-containing protein [Clostridium sp. WILCCON 0269]|uniref:Leucine-rich repeat domain-containing protein n=1 Tax=Candidatus Clostridium eludens TaxID=3381663 RepID=A0ABW8SGZ5_9CLOT
MVSILQEPRGETYRILIEYAANRCSQFVFVVNSSCGNIQESGLEVLKQLKPYLIKKIKHNKWPGTISYGECSLIYHFQCNKNTVSILQNSVNALYDWYLPKLPMDLSFLDKNNNGWLVSVAHEKMSWLNISHEEKQDILDKFPNLQLGEDKKKTIEQLLQNKEEKYLSLSHMNLHQIPEVIADFKELQGLSILDDNINEIPEFIGNLTNLNRLIISGKQIRSIPSSIFYLSKLEELRIENTSISGIPKEIENLKNLSVLDLSNNRILDLPEEVCNLGDLWVLFAPFNQIKKIPDNIGKLTNLWYFGIHNNKINKLPESIINLVDLKYISLFNNDFKDIEYEITKFKDIKPIRVDTTF